MNQRDLLIYVLTAFERLAIPHMVVGSFASYVYSEIWNSVLKKVEGT